MVLEFWNFEIDAIVNLHQAVNKQNKNSFVHSWQIPITISQNEFSTNILFVPAYQE